MENYRSKLAEANQLLALPPSYENPLGNPVYIETDLAHVERQFIELESSAMMLELRLFLTDAKE